MNNMNQMMGNMNMNQPGMSSTLMTNFAMDDTAMKIKAIIEPYNKQIIELQNIIRQKDFEISVLKEKLNAYKNNQMNINNNQMGMGMNNINQMGMGMNINNNQMGMNINNNQMGMGMNNNNNQMGMNMNNNLMGMNMMNQNIMNNQMPPINPILMNDKPMWMWHYNNLNDNQNLNNGNNSSNKINIIFEYKEKNSNTLILCEYYEKIRDVVKRFFDKIGIESKHYNYYKFIFNCKNLNMDLTVSENGMTNNSRIIVIKTQDVRNNFNISLEQNKENNEDKVGRKIHIIFMTVQGVKTNIIFDANNSVGDLLKLYLKRMDRQDLISSLMEGSTKIVFVWNAIQLKINDTTKVKDVFKNNVSQKIVVNDIDGLIGA